MFCVARLCFFYYMANSIGVVMLMSMQDWSKNDVIVDINKGYTLQRIGAYSPNLVEEIIHTFIPSSRFCIVSPQADVCQYASAPVTTNMALLTTMMASHNIIRTISSYNSDSVSRLIEKDIIRVLEENHPDNIIRNTKSIVHFVNNQFYYNKTDVNKFTTMPSINTVNNHPVIPRVRSDSIEKFIKQISVNKVDFEFLSKSDLKVFLAAAFSTIDRYYTISNLQQSLDTFFQYVVGQSVFALRYCSLAQENSLTPQPCIAVSTLFLRIQPDMPSTFLVYHLIPLPVIHNNDIYVYSTLPKIIGIDLIDQRVITWNEDIDIEQCLFSRLVLCQRLRVSVSLKKPSCISQLLDNSQLSTNICQVKRSRNIQQDFMQIGDGLWLFFNILPAEQCRIFSNVDDTTESISINEPTLISIPCNKSVICMDSQISTTSCTPRQTFITSRSSLHSRSQARIFLPIKNMTQTIISSYQVQFEQATNNLMTAFSLKKSSLKEIFKNLLTYTVSAITFVLIIMLIYLFKLIKYKLQKDINYIESTVDTILAL